MSRPFCSTFLITVEITVNHLLIKLATLLSISLFDLTYMSYQIKRYVYIAQFIHCLETPIIV